MFISQAMNGKTEDEILKDRERAVKAIMDVCGKDTEIIDSYFDDEPKSGNVALKYLSWSLEKLADADLVYFLKGWENARGCKIENECAVAYGIDTMEEL